MSSINNVLSALVDFLNEVQSLGIIKEFNLIPCEQQDKEASLKAEESFSSFLEKIGYASKDTNCSDVTLAEDGKQKPAAGKKPVDADSLQTDTNKISTGNFSSSVTEPIEITDQENKPESNIGSYSDEKKMDVEMQNDKNEVSATTEAVESPNLKLVQITVDSNEMKRRINKFITRKKGEGAEWNVQEFCGRSYIDEQDPVSENLSSCARVDAAFVQRRGLKSHIKVSKVRNTCGPQTLPHSGVKKIKLERIENEDHTIDASLETINERLSHMEHHLRLKSVDTLRTSIFKRLKALEDRILFLEGTSPEYFNNLPEPDSALPKKKNTSVQDKAFSNCSAEDVRKKIQTLKEILKCKKEILS